MKRHKFFKKARHALATGFALSVFMLPPLLLGWWFTLGSKPQDPRQVVPVSAFHARAVDTSSTPLAPFHEPLVSITFDDGWESVYTTGFPVLNQYGFHSTQYIITDTLAYPGYMSVAQLKAMQSTGTEIASHTISHADLTTLSTKELAHELADSQKTLEQDFGGRIPDFTSPYGAYNAYTLSMISKYYHSQKNAEGTVDVTTDPLGSINVAGSFDPMNIVSFSVRDDTTLVDIQRMLVDTEQHDGWLVLTYHQIDTSGETFSVAPDMFRAQMQLISNSPIRSATVGQVLEGFEKR